ncbi:hypothetical protein [Paenibacillus soyae]|uniref:Uncharacterized protein n=1 Tax=Paenibacillus soyae TaxID=2969249 RepID=A0A9X2MQX4_9BACL|nr:hypothetical protein [Paenibacillus soyae]MCR2804539.1 hypothetical protein [Paenibacillus soyae]
MNTTARIVLNYTTAGPATDPAAQADFQEVVAQLTALGYTVKYQLQLEHGFSYILGKEFSP